MMLIEETTVPATVLPVPGFREHLRLGTGFADDAVQDALVESYLRAAIAAIEARIGKALLTRRFRWSLAYWRRDEAQALPVAPVSAILSLTVKDRDGVSTVVDAARYRLSVDMHRPRIVSLQASLPAIPAGGAAEIVFDAGFGADWSAVPFDLAQAVYLLGAHYYEHRHEAAVSEAAMPFGVMALIERWRTVRVLGGGAS